MLCRKCVLLNSFGCIPLDVYLCMYTCGCIPLDVYLWMYTCGCIPVDVYLFFASQSSFLWPLPLQTVDKEKFSICYYKRRNVVNVAYSRFVFLLCLKLEGGLDLITDNRQHNKVSKNVIVNYLINVFDMSA